jgi:hypothetical protein
MSAARALREDMSRDGAVVMDDDQVVLQRILDPDVHLAVWQRRAARDLAGLAGLDWDAIADIDQDVPVVALASAIPGALRSAGYPDVVALADVIVPLASDFAALMACEALRIRLDVIETDACRKFHADQVTVRLLMPLVGPGTQWVHANAEPQVPEGELRIGDVGLFKGRVWAEEPVILHRSPPIAAMGITRLLLVIDPGSGLSRPLR